MPANPPDEFSFQNPSIGGGSANALHTYPCGRRFQTLVSFHFGSDRARTSIAGSLRGLKRSGAVQKAEELKPDLILLDVGLLKLNGIAAARQIRTFSPKSKILFLSQESSTAVVREALEIGAGYVVKTDARRELLSAVKGVMSEEQFLSSTAKRHTLEETVAELAREGLQ